MYASLFDLYAVLDALLFQTVEQAAFAELAIEVHTGLVIVEVDIVQKLLEPLAGHDPQIVVALDLQFVRVARLVR